MIQNHDTIIVKITCNTTNTILPKVVILFHISIKPSIINIFNLPNLTSYFSLPKQQVSHVFFDESALHPVYVVHNYEISRHHRILYDI